MTHGAGERETEAGRVGMCHAPPRGCALDTFQSQRLKNKPEKPTKYRRNVREDSEGDTVVLKVRRTVRLESAGNDGVVMDGESGCLECARTSS